MGRGMGGYKKSKLKTGKKVGQKAVKTKKTKSVKKEVKKAS
jgi:hypothetical protein